jgi:hypothetical protein
MLLCYLTPVFTPISPTQSDGPKKSIRSPIPKNDGSDSASTPPTTSRARRKPLTAEDMARVGSTSERSNSSKDLTPNSKAINNTTTSSVFLSAGFGKGRISFGTTNAKERKESIHQAKERKESLILAKEKKEKELMGSAVKEIGKEKENDGRNSPKIKEKEIAKDKEIIKEKENEARINPKNKGNKKEAQKAKEKVNQNNKAQDKKAKDKEMIAAKEKVKDVEVDRKSKEQESGEKDDVANVDAEAVKAILLNRKSSQVVVIHPPFGVLATPEKAIEGQVRG